MTQHIHEGAARYQPGHHGNNSPAPSATQALANPQQLLTEHIDLWTSAVRHKSTAGRGSNRKIELAGINKLRELILELAVRGKLVPQNPDDEPASELLKRIEAEKAQLVKDGKLKKQKPLPAVTDEEKPFELPEGWEWVRLGTFFNSIISGGTPSKRNADYWNGDIPWASVKDLGKSKYIHATQDYITADALESGSKLVDKGDILICTRMGLGKIGVAQVPIAINQDLKGVKLSSQIELEYFLNTYSRIKIEGTGTTVAGITQDQLLGYVVALPPLTEQQRIVAKVDELMALCDQLEQQSEHQLDAHQQLTDTLLSALLTPAAGALTDATSAQELSDNWQRLAQHFDLLFSGPMGAWAIDRLKDTILQLAVMGKLVPQNPDDEPASELLKRIDAEKARLVKEGKIKKQKPLPPVNDDEKPFELPQGWVWSCISAIFHLENGDRSKNYPNKAALVEKGIPFVNAGQLENGGVSTEDLSFISEEHFSRLSGGKFLDGDILFCLRGSLGKNALVKNFGIGAIASSLVILKTAMNGLQNFAMVYLNSNLANIQIKTYDNGTAQPNLSAADLGKFLVPLPPLAEQQRIVAKVDELFALCDQLKERLQHASDTQLNLTDAIVEQALS
ncbi:restriction endonuclease subunit S [Nitrincola tapanii]|uniref:Restriction endonuclease subunit S n=1 Tax=Nitrincola tapanii TaxID=1708751 RepID=A0A5A9W773_9GAMM|nr:restriction endonuclease subunit S [Nitrincola tapanii]KAA0876572.1 restriction endonuclease subunit S [Nitrincola tapanii]